jgi:hypothetical protein
VSPVATPSERASHEARTARATRRPPTFAATFIAFVIIFAIAWMFFVRSGSSVPEPQVNGVRGTYTWAAASGAGTQKGAFSAASNGDAGGEADPGVTTPGGSYSSSAYDAAARTESQLVQDGPTVTEVRTIGAWPPVWRVATRSPLDYQGLAAIVRTAVEDGDDNVGIKPLKQGDRAVWRAAMTMGGKLIDLVVDQETGIVTWCDDGGATFTAKVDWASPPPGGTTYTVTPPAGATTKKVVDTSFVYAESPAAAGRRAGYDPLVSDLAPDGYRLAAAATADDALRPLTWLATEKPDLRVPPSFHEPVVAQAYTRGLGWFTVEQSGPGWTRAYGSALDPLLHPDPDSRLSYQETTLQYGALKGETASTWYESSGPSLFVRTARRAVFITGALTRQELVSFAEGLKPVPATP